jgi:hypothetical protein
VQIISSGLFRIAEVLEVDLGATIQAATSKQRKSHP